MPCSQAPGARCLLSKKCDHARDQLPSDLARHPTPLSPTLRKDPREFASPHPEINELRALVKMRHEIGFLPLLPMCLVPQTSVRG